METKLIRHIEDQDWQAANLVSDISLFNPFTKEQLKVIRDRAIQLNIMISLK